MLRCTPLVRRYRTAWRELLHPLPVWARKQQWLKRDTVEVNEAVLREPYYRIKSYAQPAAHPDEGEASALTEQSSNYAVARQLRAPRQATSPARLQELREELAFSSTVGPQLARAAGAGPTYEDEYGSRLRPRYPQSWDTVPPHQPSRTEL